MIDQPNPWTAEDEGSHAPNAKEWWTMELLFSTPEDGRQWNLMVSMAYNQEAPSCFFQYVLFDITNRRCVLHKDIDDDITKFSHAEGTVDLRYEGSTITGRYPSYHLSLRDEAQGMAVDVDFTAAALPHWVAQEQTCGILPIGLNFYRYGFLPNCNLAGTMTVHGKTYTITGKGYLEHAYGNWSYQHPFQMLAGLRKTLATYLRLGHWWLAHHGRRIPDRLSISSENNQFGYDWFWGISDKGWSLFFGNSLMWFSEGPSFGTLAVTEDGTHYWEFCDVTFRYNSLFYLKDYDMYYPSDIELEGRLGDKTLHLRCTATTEPYEYISPHKKSKLFKAFVLVEMPGTMQGTFTDGTRTVDMAGACKIVPLRHPPIRGHQEITVKIVKPPAGVGADVVLTSHRARRRIAASLHLLPRPRLHGSITPLDPTRLPREARQPKL